MRLNTPIAILCFSATQNIINNEYRNISKYIYILGNAPDLPVFCSVGDRSRNRMLDPEINYHLTFSVTRKNTKTHDWNISSSVRESTDEYMAVYRLLMRLSDLGQAWG